MVSKRTASYMEDPLFQSALRNMQTGEWMKGLAELDQLLVTYPSAGELKGMRQEMQLRSRIDEYELVDHEQEKKRQIMRWGIRLVVLILIAGFAYWGLVNYSLWIRGQMAAARQRLENQVRGVELTVKFRDGQNLLEAGRSDLALAMFQDISSVNPDYPGLSASIEKAQRLKALDEKYAKAMSLINLNDNEGALSLLEEINAEEPYYKDVSIRIADIKSQFLLGDLQAQADKAFQNQQWEESASKYETVRAISPEYKSDFIEERLFTCYMNAAEDALSTQSDSFANLEKAESYFRKALALRPQDKNVAIQRDKIRNQFKDSLARTYVKAAKSELSNQSDSLQALAIAEDYFRKALALRPDDPEIKLQQELARSYLKAQDDFNKGNYDAVITSLETVYSIDPEYASGTSRQTLYEAYIARGNNFISGGDFQLALSDFQRAAVLAGESSDPGMRLFAARIKVAEAEGALGDYQAAVLVYQETFDALDLTKINLDDSPATRDKLLQAERYAQARSYKWAFSVYRDVAPKVLLLYSSVTHVVQSGDYLPMLASRYHTTMEAIIQANNLGNSKHIEIGQELIIPSENP